MSEWRLFSEDEVPHFTQRDFFEGHHWVDPRGQQGHAERIAMVVELVRGHVKRGGVASLVDLGCGDGSLLGALGDLGVPMWGYDLGQANIKVAQNRGLDVRYADILTDSLEYGDLVVVAEVLEHLIDPRAFLRSLPGDKLIASSPSTETDEWHYRHHAWAWDLDGYANLLRGCGWSVVEHVECSGGDNFLNGKWGYQRFQAVAAQREQCA